MAVRAATANARLLRAVTTVRLDRHARSAIEAAGVQRRLLETGGALFGWRQDDDIVIACASGPGPGAKHRPRSFQPGPRVTASAMNAVRLSSGGRYGFLGSWHTHPLAAPIPSAVDTGTARGMADQEDLLLPEPLLLILSTTGTSYRVRARELRAWLWSRETERLHDLPIDTVELPERHCPTAAQLFL